MAHVCGLTGRARNNEVGKLSNIVEISHSLSPPTPLLLTLVAKLCACETDI
jgi:hypothetical protein